jgi:hypothetical protein
MAYTRFDNNSGLKGTVPTIMAPSYFDIQADKADPIYYSLQFPTTRTFSPNSKKSSTMAAMRELKSMCEELLGELIKDNYFCSNTIIQHIAKSMSVSFFHNTEDMDGLIDCVTKLIDSDDRFLYSTQQMQGLIPAGDSKFFRGCIKIEKN